MVQHTPPQGAEANPKRQKKTDADTSKALVVSDRQPDDATMEDTANAAADADLVFREQKRVTLELNPLYLKRLAARREIGYTKPHGKKKLELKTFEIDVKTFRDAMTEVLSYALLVRYQTLAITRNSEIEAEIEEIVPYTVDVCMSALYAKLRIMHRSYGKHATRYTTAPSYSKEVELPLPFALMIQEFGAFETQSMLTNYVYAPTYPEGVQNEGRAGTSYPITEYLSYLPTLKELGIPLKAIDARIKLGSAWWTYKVCNTHGTTDLVCTLPPSHYSDLSAQLYSTVLVPDAALCCGQIVKLPDDTIEYGVRLREMKPGSCVRTFLALCHGPEEEWSYGTS